MKLIFLFFIFLCVSSLGDVEDEVRLEVALHHVEKLSEYAPRLAGSGTATDEVIGGVFSAGIYLSETLKEYGYHVEIEEFPLTTFQITECTLVIDFDGDFETYDQLDLSKRVIPPTLRHMDVSYDMTAPLAFLDEPDLGGKIPVFEYWLYYDPEYADVAGHFSITLVYKKDGPAFCTHFREAFSISYEDYLLIRKNKTPETMVWMKFSSHSKEVKGYNICGIKPGGNSTIILTAHYDSVYTDGAIDNGSGVAAVLETARILARKDTNATLYFVFFDGEEIGLLGSEAFVKAHDLPHSVCINVDSISSGDTVYVGCASRYEDMWPTHYHTDGFLDAYIASLAESVLGYSPQQWYLEDVGGYSDFVTFQEKGIPSTDITTMEKEATKVPAISEGKLSEYSTTWIRGGIVFYYQEDRFSKIIPYIHTSYDNLDHFNTDLFLDATQVVAKATYMLSKVSEGEVEPAQRVFIGLAAAVVVCILYAVRASVHQEKHL